MTEEDIAEIETQANSTDFTTDPHKILWNRNEQCLALIVAMRKLNSELEKLAVLLCESKGQTSYQSRLVQERDAEIERLKAKLCRANRSNPPFVTEIRPGPYLERCSVCDDWHPRGVTCPNLFAYNKVKP